MFTLAKLDKFIVLAPLVFLVVSFLNVNNVYAVLRQVDISWSYDSNAVPNLAGFRIYHENAYLCDASNPALRQLSCTVDVTEENNEFTMTAVDDDGNESAHSQPVNVMYTPPASGIPVANAINASTMEDVVLNSFLTASDPENDPLTFTVVSNPSRGGVQLVSSTTGEFRYTPNADATGTDSFTFLVNDGSNDSNTATVTISVTPVNDRPTAVADQRTINEDRQVSIQVIQNDNDVDGDALSLTSVGNANAGTTRMSGNSVIYTPMPDYSGTDSFTYQITDGSLTANSTVTITVRPVNDPPRAFDGTATTSEDTAVIASLSATDEENNSLTYTVVADGAKGHAELLNSTTGSYRYTPNANIYGTDSFTFRVSDGSAFSNTAIVTITITAVNDPLVANAGPDQTVNYGDPVTLDASNSHPVDDIESMQWTQVEGPDVTLSDPHAIQPTFDSAEIEYDTVSLVFELTVTNFSGQEDRDTSIVNITWANQSPTADAGGEQEVFEGDQVMLDGALSNDHDDGIQSYFWNQIGGPDVTLSNPSAMRPTFNAPETGLDGASLVFELTVSDFNDLQAQDTTIVNVSWVNDPPIADAGTDQTAQVGVTVVLDASKSQDSDDGIRSYRWTQTEGFPVTLSEPTSLKPTFTLPAENSGNNRLKFQVTVTDNGGLQSSDSCAVDFQDASDINDDGVINRHDFRLFRRAKEQCVGDKRYNAAADLDGDGCVTTEDFMIFYGQFSTK